MTDHAPRAIAPLEIRTVGPDVLVHDATHAKVHVLNRAAARVLELCDGTLGVDALAARLAAGTSAPPERVRADVQRIVEVFAGLGLVSYARPVSSDAAPCSP